MILEILEWCLTPCSIHARRAGFLSRQIAIRHRARRCRREWASHLKSSKDFISKHAIGGQCCVILGSGHLHDIDLEFLKTRFQEVVLVDVVHPFEIQRIARFSHRQIRLLTVDLSPVFQESKNSARDPEILDLMSQADFVVSACLLSQLAWALPRELHHAVCENHLRLLRLSKSALLITDTARRFDGDWEPLLPGYNLPEPWASWIWDIAPPREHGIPGKGMEQRLVEGFVIR